MLDISLLLQRSMLDQLMLTAMLDGCADNSLLVWQSEIGQSRVAFAPGAKLRWLRQLLEDEVDLCLALSFIEA